MTRKSKQVRRKSKQVRRRGRRRRDWTRLPPELIDLIARKLTICDYIKFRSVCAAWRSCGDTYHQQLPLLILPHGEFSSTIPFFNPADRRVFEFPLPNEAQGKFAFGSSYGWLVMLDHWDNSVSLLNPITQAHIILPPLPYYVDTITALLCSNPTAPPKQPRQILLAIITSLKKLLIYRHGDDYWAVIEKPLEFSKYLEIAYLNEEAALYLVDEVGRLAVLDLASSTCRPLTNNTPIPEIRSLPSDLLVTATGELLLVAWDLSLLPHPQFYVFKLDKSDEGCLKWVRTTNINGSMLFQSGDEVIQVCNQEFIGDQANKIYCLNGRCFQTRNEIEIEARVEIWDIISPSVDSRTRIYRFPPLSTFKISNTTRIRERGYKSLGFTWMIPSFS